MPNGKARQFTFVMEAKSVITRPAGGQQLRDPGFHEITGLAWSGRGRIRGSDVSTDGGTTSAPATLQETVLPKCLTRFRLPWMWDGANPVPLADVARLQVILIVDTTTYAYSGPRQQLFFNLENEILHGCGNHEPCGYILIEQCQTW